MGSRRPHGRENGDSKWHLSRSHSVLGTVLLATVACWQVTNNSGSEVKGWLGQDK